MSEETKRKCLFKQHPVRTIVESIALFITSFFLIANSNIGGIHHSRRPSRQDACFNNQRVLLGAIEMYNMDNNEMIKSYNPSVRDSLIKWKYLRDSFMENVECEIVSEGDLTDKGFIYCVNHGGVDGKKEGKDEFASLTPKADMIHERNKNLLVLGLLFGPTLIYWIINLL